MPVVENQGGGEQCLRLMLRHSMKPATDTVQLVVLDDMVLPHSVPLRRAA